MTLNDLYWPPKGIAVISCVHPNIAQTLITFALLSKGKFGSTSVSISWFNANIQHEEGVTRLDSVTLEVPAFPYI